MTARAEAVALPPSDELADQLGRARLESETLYAVIGVISSSYDLDRTLDGIINLLARATRAHACFIYLRRGDRLHMRAASPIYAHLVNQVEFGIDEGLAGWAVRHNKTSFIRENALSDPRTNYIEALEEERFQSIGAVPIPTRDGDVMGAIILHTVAPREFDEGTMNVLTNTGPLIAGAIENAALYSEARSRVSELTQLSVLSEEIAAAETRVDLHRVATRGVRSLLGCESVRLYDVEDDQLLLVAADPPTEGDESVAGSGAGMLLELVRQRDDQSEDSARRISAVLDLDQRGDDVLAVPVAAGGEHLGLLAAISGAPFPKGADGLLRAIANQVAVAVKRVELIERLTEENVIHDLFKELEDGHANNAEVLSRRARCDLQQPHVYVHVERAQGNAEDDLAWPELTERTEAALRRISPGARYDAGNEAVRAVVPLSAGTERELKSLEAGLAGLAADIDVMVGRSEVHRGAEEARNGLREAAEAAHVAFALKDKGAVLAYRDLGAYRYLVHLAGEDTPNDPYMEAISTLAEYDQRRNSQLIATLEQYLFDRRRVTETARALTVHPNTLRQRLERIETLTGLDLAAADLLALELAIKLSRLRQDRPPA